jgi:hypothetical protein
MAGFETSTEGDVVQGGLYVLAAWAVPIALSGPDSLAEEVVSYWTVIGMTLVPPYRAGLPFGHGRQTYDRP